MEPPRLYTGRPLKVVPTSAYWPIVSGHAAAALLGPDAAKPAAAAVLGDRDGDIEGLVLGEADGFVDGLALGGRVGNEADGEAVGSVGASVGCLVGDSRQQLISRYWCHPLDESVLLTTT